MTVFYHLSRPTECRQDRARKVVPAPFVRISYSHDDLHNRTTGYHTRSSDRAIDVDQDDTRYPYQSSLGACLSKPQSLTNLAEGIHRLAAQPNRYVNIVLIATAPQIKSNLKVFAVNVKQNTTRGVT